MEYMRLLGWADSDWKPFRWQQVWDDAFDHTEGLANMAGNALAGFQYAAHYMALMATWGSFWPTCWQSEFATYQHQR